MITQGIFIEILLISMLENNYVYIYRYIFIYIYLYIYINNLRACS